MCIIFNEYVQLPKNVPISNLKKPPGVIQGRSFREVGVEGHHMHPPAIDPPLTYKMDKYLTGALIDSPIEIGF